MCKDSVPTHVLCSSLISTGPWTYSLRIRNLQPNVYVALATHHQYSFCNKSYHQH